MALSDKRHLLRLQRVLVCVPAPTSHMAAHNHLLFQFLGKLAPSSEFYEHQAHTQNAHTSIQANHLYIKIFEKSVPISAHWHLCNRTGAMSSSILVIFKHYHGFCKRKGKEQRDKLNRLHFQPPEQGLQKNLKLNIDLHQPLSSSSPHVAKLQSRNSILG